MYQHMILMCSDYSMQRRIAFHKSYLDIFSMLEFEKIGDKIMNQFSNIEFSMHHITTTKRTSNSIKEYDKYFEDVEFFSDIDQFKQNIKKSIEITPEDIVKYILLKGKFDQLQIQKLLFFIYSEYLKQHDEPLFSDKFKAWAYGPVIPKIYGELNKYKKQKILLGDYELEKIKLELKLERVPNKESILACIDSILYTYGTRTGGELIEQTHKKGSPWDLTIKQFGLNSEIPINIIKDYVRI